ncbi:hypothetical protein KSP35_23265 [Aquihabitans sp. G128]|uniref:hypothetical protein n=1 Tax=Aquihabitans sp. G128 TaxID=2849779 RepID=UPI001C220AEE|nr:hypothetical protein [Aquihabitans sp. G128]QXC61194.1 hypothetical protein KSP35_23265 [Aquihabitans sp. G128]
MAVPPTSASPAPDARHRLLAAGAELFSSFRPEDVLPGVRSVCRAAGLPTGSFYNCFGNATAYHRDLIRWLGANDETAAVSDDTSATLVDLAGQVPELAPTGAQLMSAMATAAGADAERMIVDAGASARAQYLLSALAEDEGSVGADIREHYGALYEHLAANQLAGTQALLDAVGARIRPPFTAEGIGLLISALTDGFVLRAKIDPSLDVVTLVEDATRALIVGLVCHPDDDRDLDDLAAATLDAAAVRGLAERRSA